MARREARHYAGFVSADVAATHTPVDFLELSHVHDGLRDAILNDISALIDANAFTNGPAVAEFEAAFAVYCGVAGCVGVGSGLDALRLGLLAGGIEPGDEVIVPANTFIATAEAVTQAGGVPVFVDASEADWNIDVGAVAAALSERTRFLLPVHLYGQLADMRALLELAERRGLRVLEDAAQAHGASRDGLAAGASGFAGAFSFYPGKNLGAMGDAGALVTDDLQLAANVRKLREHGQARKYRHELEGFTSRLDTIQALVLLRKLPLLDGWNDARRAAADAYSQNLVGVGDLRLPPVPAGSDPVWHLYVVRTAHPERLAEFLRERGIGTGRHYPQPLHLSPPYERLGYTPGAFPVAEALAAEALSLPIFPGISEEQLAAVVEAVRAYFRG
jgi:dTDP-4-amino-4,6-dideoxygalactose transaminase